VLKDTDAYLTLNRQRSLDDGFMHAVFNPSFNALATAMATRVTVTVIFWRSPASVTLSRR
jgi:membrane glycosyltransferase